MIALEVRGRDERHNQVALLVAEVRFGRKRIPIDACLPEDAPDHQLLVIGIIGGLVIHGIHPISTKPRFHRPVKPPSPANIGPRIHLHLAIEVLHDLRGVIIGIRGLGMNLHPEMRFGPLVIDALNRLS